MTLYKRVGPPSMRITATKSIDFCEMQVQPLSRKITEGIENARQEHADRQPASQAEASRQPCTTEWYKHGKEKQTGRQMARNKEGRH